MSCTATAVDERPDTSTFEWDGSPAPLRCIEGDAEHEIDRVWERWGATHDPAARNQLIVHYSPLVKFVAGRVGAGLPNNVDGADLVSNGLFGLIDAIERFDPSRGVKFESFAVPRIRGAVFDGLRAQDWVPRSVRTRAKQIQTTFSHLEGSLGRAPSEREIAEHLRISEPKLRTWLSSIATTTVGPLDQTLLAGVEPSSLHADAPDSPAGALEAKEMGRLVRHEVRELPEREKTVLSLYYEEGLTLAEIGRVLGVTESRVCQIHTKAVLHLRARLSARDAA